MSQESSQQPEQPMQALQKSVPATEPRFRPEMTVDAALASHPSVRWVFAAYHLGGCSGCSSSSAETLAEVAEGYGISLESLLRDLNSLAAEPSISQDDLLERDQKR